MGEGLPVALELQTGGSRGRGGRNEADMLGEAGKSG